MQVLIVIISLSLKDNAFIILNMKRFILLFVILIFSCNSDKNQSPINFITVFESSKGTETASYHQTIQYYKDLADSYKEISIQEIGETDSGKPLHIVTLNPEREFDFDDIRKNKRIILINNGIHPGESDGIDATMMFFRDIVQGKIEITRKHSFSYHSNLQCWRQFKSEFNDQNQSKRTEGIWI